MLFKTDFQRHVCKVLTTFSICVDDNKWRAWVTFDKPSALPNGGISVSGLIFRASNTHCNNSSWVLLEPTPRKLGPKLLGTPETPGRSWQAKQLPVSLLVMMSKPVSLDALTCAMAQKGTNRQLSKQVFMHMMRIVSLQDKGVTFLKERTELLQHIRVFPHLRRSL